MFFARWILRISRNAHSVAPLSQRYTPGWAIGYFFIPIVCLWRPYQALRDAYESFLDLSRDGKDNVIFPLWWFAWIVSNILGRLLLQSTMEAEELDEMMHASLITVGSDSFDIFLNIIAIFMVTMVTRSCISHHNNQQGEPMLSGG